MSEREGAGKPAILLLQDWFVEGDRLYGLTEQRRYINMQIDHSSDNRFHEGGRALSTAGVSAVLGRPVGRLGEGA